MNGPINDSLWYRFDASRYGSDGFVERMSPSSSNVTGNLLWRPGSRAELRFSVDYLDDDVGSYFGTPLLPFCRDRRSARRDYDHDRRGDRCAHWSVFSTTT